MSCVALARAAYLQMLGARNIHLTETARPQFRVLADCLQRRRTPLTPATSSDRVISALVPGSC